MPFLDVLGLLAAAVLICATVIVIRARSPKHWARTAALAGVLSLAAGIALFAVVIAIGLNRYDEQTYPAWLEALYFVALALGAGGLVVVFTAAVGSARR